MNGDRESFAYAVDEMMDVLANTLHTVIDGLTIKLYNCFNEGERQEINASRTNITKVKEFFTSLKTKEVDAYERCLTAMNELKHPALAKALREKWYSAPRRQSTSQASSSVASMYAVLNNVKLYV